MTATGLPRTTQQRWAYRIVAAVIVVGLAVTGALSWVSYRQYSDNESRLIDLRAKELAAVLQAALPSTVTPLTAAAALADATGGSTVKFETFASQYAGPSPQHQFSSMSLWRAGALSAGPRSVIGEPLTGPLTEIERFIAGAAQSPVVHVLPLLTLPRPAIGYAIGDRAFGGAFVVYAESLLPATRRSRLQSNTAFSDLNYVVYLGAQTPQDLLVTNLSNPPIRGRHSSATVPFGDAALTIVVSARQPLGGALPQRLPLIVLIVGALLTGGAALITLRLIQRRQTAEYVAGRFEVVAAENQRLYAEQRDIALRLQHALLPKQVPRFPGVETAARFEAGERGVEIGGDWYDLLPLPDGRLLLVVGDVTGRGVSAAEAMASLRFAVHAFAVQDDPPEAILTKLSKLLVITGEQRLATVLCAQIEVATHEIVLASAGHLPPLLISDGHADYMDGTVGPPIGVSSPEPYASTRLRVPAAATMIAFTDGLIERRVEPLDAGLDRLRRAAGSGDGALGELLERLLAEVREPSAEDDTVIVGVRWTA